MFRTCVHHYYLMSKNQKTPFAAHRQIQGSKAMVVQNTESQEVDNTDVQQILTVCCEQWPCCTGCCSFHILGGLTTVGCLTPLLLWWWWWRWSLHIWCKILFLIRKKFKHIGITLKDLKTRCGSSYSGGNMSTGLNNKLEMLRMSRASVSASDWGGLCEWNKFWMQKLIFERVSFISGQSMIKVLYIGGTVCKDRLSLWSETVAKCHPRIPVLHHE